MNVEQKYTKKELRAIAKDAPPGFNLHCSTQTQVEYLAIRQQLGWPNSRSIKKRLVNPRQQSK